jgi:hypothetical protein
MTHITKVKKSKTAILPHCLIMRCQPFCKMHYDIDLVRHPVYPVIHIYPYVCRALTVFAYAFLPVRHRHTQSFKLLQQQGKSCRNVRPSLSRQHDTMAVKRQADAAAVPSQPVKHRPQRGKIDLSLADPAAPVQPVQQTADIEKKKTLAGQKPDKPAGIIQSLAGVQRPYPGRNRLSMRKNLSGCARPCHGPD